MTAHAEKILSIASRFAIRGKLREISPYKSGHINETFLSQWETADGGTAQFIHQWVNNHVFKNVPGLMSNIERVTTHLKKKFRPGSRECTLEIVPTAEGEPYLIDDEGQFWRTYVFIERTASFGVCTGLPQAREAAKILGTFQRELLDLDPTGLVDTIPFFHHTPRRYETFEQAVKNDAVKRAGKVAREIEFALSRRATGAALIEGLASGTLPLRVTHNDMKLNNVLFDETTGEGICIVDLDTCMAGSILYDFGDLVRNVSVPAAEDETDLTKVEVSVPYFGAVAEGYAESMRDSISEAEYELLVVSPRIMALTLGVRFLTDYLEGDHYFRIHRPRHNLDRARSQFKIVESMERREGEIQRIVATAFGR